jgi:hypothetical protein
MDREYLEKHNLMKAHEQFMRLSEGYLATTLDEEGDEDGEQQDMPQDGGMHDAQQGDANQGGNMEGGMPDMQQGGDMGQDMSQEGPMGDGMAPSEDMGGAPDWDADGDPSDLDTGNDDEVIDVEDITSAQEKLNSKQNAVGKDVNNLADRITQMIDKVENLKGAIEKNNQDILSLRADLDKRVPTQKERLEMRSLDMYPYSESPNEYWKNKEKEGVYQAKYDSGQNPKERELQITRDDVNNYSDSEIEKSFDSNLRQTMKDIFPGY